MEFIYSMRIEQKGEADWKESCEVVFFFYLSLYYDQEVFGLDTD